MKEEPTRGRSFRVVPERPFSLALTAERFARFPDLVDLFDGRCYRRLLPVRPAALLAVSQEGNASRAVLNVRLEGPGADRPLACVLALRLLDRTLGVRSDFAAFEKAFRKDPLIGTAVRRFRGVRVAGAPTVWESLVLAVLAQQIHLAFAASIRRELVLAFGRRARIGGDLFFDFPTARRIAAAGETGLEGFRLSGGKRGTLLRLAAEFNLGRVTEQALERLPDEEVVARLTSIRGVGRWTAEVALLRGLKRPDAFPAGDLSIVKNLAIGVLGRAGPSNEREMREISKRWQPHRSLALVTMYAAMGGRRAKGGARKERASRA
ncbi:MAG: hypothetical protein ABJC07_11915 [Acidobacteriota bacterium]